MVEHQPSKLDTWVRFPSPALYFARKYGICEVYQKNIFWYTFNFPLNCEQIAYFVVIFGVKKPGAVIVSGGADILVTGIFHDHMLRDVLLIHGRHTPEAHLMGSPVGYTGCAAYIPKTIVDFAGI